MLCRQSRLPGGTAATPPERDARTGATFLLRHTSVSGAVERTPVSCLPGRRPAAPVQLRRILQDKRTQVAEGQALLDALPTGADAGAWIGYLHDRIAAAGGILGVGTVGPPPIRPGLSDRAGYARPPRVARDPRFEPDLIEQPWWNDQTPLERHVYVAIGHANEIWATEVPLLVAWELDAMPWEFYRDLARWAWDECRHAMMGERRLAPWGFQIGVDYPMIDDAYQCIVTEPPVVLLGLLNAFERAAPPKRKALKAAFEQMGDGGSAQDINYDWADEAIHMSYGNRWMEYLMRDEDERDAIRQRTLEMWEAYLVWAKEQPLGNYEPFESRIRARLSAITGGA